MYVLFSRKKIVRFFIFLYFYFYLRGYVKFGRKYKGKFVGKKKGKNKLKKRGKERKKKKKKLKKVTIGKKKKKIKRKKDEKIKKGKKIEKGRELKRKKGYYPKNHGRNNAQERDQVCYVRAKNGLFGQAALAVWSTTRNDRCGSELMEYKWHNVKGLFIAADDRQYFVKRSGIELRDLKEAFELNYPSVEIDDIARCESSTTGDASKRRKKIKYHLSVMPRIGDRVRIVVGKT
ncbi:hypothetical protein RFI_04854 [Reticulomyxa filosa]|uniref:Uncharacterized protein n=1 Tax=Reticulomyxa filosa TaxID=46433 RepID=X6P2F7_RETFI|nr:hypothetical protein RFI_04854 [Reticulomyxa filosa]|eukprot:ETO32264.1 hypothetical protein RFI_04854 [Reticulomyxa filosa]